MNFNIPEFNFTGAQNLVVLLHGYKSKSDELDSAKTIIKEAFKGQGGVDIYAPTLPYSSKFNSTGTNNIIENLVLDLDEIWRNQKYDNVMLIGHSLGGMLLRRLFLAGVPNPPDYAGVYEHRDDLYQLNDQESTKHGWALKVGRIVLLASWDKGWSLSERVAWKYSVGLNFAGFFGRIVELSGGLLKKPGLITLFDVRQGAPFIVQTRLLWMAYRRWHNPAFRALYNENCPNKLTKLNPPPANIPNPLLIQVMGTLDDWVSPQDQIDYDVNAAEFVAQNSVNRNPEPKDSNQVNYFLLEMTKTNHKDIINFTDEHRKKVFHCALTEDRAGLGLSPYKHEPKYFDDNPLIPDFSVQNVVFVMHGIRDDGYWTHRIAKAIKEAAEKYAPDRGYSSWTQTYGYFPMGSFLLPWVRQQKVEWFMDNYVSVKARYPIASMHYVGHSNGTYLAASALERYPAARFDNIYFAGSVVHPQFGWEKMVTQERVRRFHNARGGTDWVVALLPKSLEYIADLGGAGFDGFENISRASTITQSQYYVKGGHSGAISEGHWPAIANYIVNDQKPFATDETNNALFQENKCRCLDWVAKLRIGIPLIFTVVALFMLLIFSKWLPSAYRQWDTTNVMNGHGYIIWGSALSTFVILQLFSVTHAPTGIKKYVSMCLMGVVLIGVANLILTSFAHHVMAFSQLDPSHYDVATRAAGAALTLAGLAWLLRFILKRF